MEEKYIGRKFKTELKKGEMIEDSRVYEIIQLGGKFKRMGLLPVEEGGYAGNFSFRNDRGFVITAGGVDKGKLTPRNFVQVLNCNMDTKKVFAEGEMQPSSETFTHYLIYREKKAVNAIIHVHDSLVLEHAKKLGVRSTPKHHPYGTPELAYEIEKTLGHDRYIAVKGHGVLAAAKSLWEAGRIIEANHGAASKL
jgi:ribulose-5-phosphate 4-epimerase/fuculose-1-phosphate aldolase